MPTHSFLLFIAFTLSMFENWIFKEEYILCFKSTHTHPINPEMHRLTAAQSRTPSALWVQTSPHHPLRTAYQADFMALSTVTSLYLAISGCLEAIAVVPSHLEIRILLGSEEHFKDVQHLLGRSGGGRKSLKNQRSPPVRACNTRKQESHLPQLA